MNCSKNKYDLNKLKEMYVANKEEKTQAYEIIKRYDVEILTDKELVCLHLQYCIDNGFYEEAIDLGSRAVKQYPNDADIEKVASLTFKDNYEAKANRYNREKQNNGLLDNCCFDVCISCDCYGICDICIDFGGTDTGCCDIGDFCFCDC